MKADVFFAFAPVYHLSKIFGVLPVKLVINRRGRYEGQLDFSRIIYGIGLVLVLLGAQCWGLYRDLRDGWRKSSRFNTTPSIMSSSFDLFAAVCPFVVAIIGSPLRWAHLNRVLDTISQVDKKLEIAEISTQLRKFICLLLGSLIPTVIFWLVDFIMWSCWLDPIRFDGFGIKGFINFWPLYFMQLITLITEFQIVFVVIYVGKCFDGINKCIENLIRANEFDKYFRKDFAWGSHSSADAVYDIATLHSTMADCVSSINEGYGSIMLAISLRCLLQLTATFYGLVGFAHEWHTLIDALFWLVFHFYSLLLLVEPCHSLSAKAKATGELVSHALIQEWELETEYELEAFSNILLHKRVKVTACGLFPIDRSLVATIVGTVTTYLVILLQSRKDGTD